MMVAATTVAEAMEVVATEAEKRAETVMEAEVKEVARAAGAKASARAEAEADERSAVHSRCSRCQSRTAPARRTRR